MAAKKVCLFIFMSVLVGCNNVRYKQSLDMNTGFDLPQEKMSQLSYELISQEVLKPRCVSCHGDSGGVRLESYSEVVKEIGSIKRSVFEQQTMPKRGALTNEQLSLLWNWLKLGAPEFATGGEVIPPPENLAPTFASIDKNIFQVTCIDCHNATGSGKRILLDPESLLNSPLELVLPGNPDESGLVLSVERNDSKRMPPAKDGYAPLTSEEKAAIREWIEKGAKD